MHVSQVMGTTCMTNLVASIQGCNRPSAAGMQAQLLVVNTPGRPMIPGQSAVLHVHSTSSACRITKLISLLDARTGSVVKSGPALRFLLKDQMAVVQIDLDDVVCMEASKHSSSLKRVVLRIGSTVVALGMLTEVLDG